MGATLFYYKLGKTLSQIGTTLLLQIRASAVTNWGSYHKLGQPLLQNRQLLQIGAKCITSWGRYYKLGQLLQIEALQPLVFPFVETGSKMIKMMVPI